MNGLDVYLKISPIFKLLFFLMKVWKNSFLWSLGYPGSGGLGWRGHTYVKNLPQVSVEVCAKLGRGWSGFSRVKEGHRDIQTACLIFIDK